LHVNHISFEWIWNPQNTSIAVKFFRRYGKSNMIGIRWK